MAERRNDQGQPIGPEVPGWAGAAPLPRSPMMGRTCDVVPLTMDHGAALYAAFNADQTGTLWTYMPSGPFLDLGSFDAWLTNCCSSTDPLFFAITDKEGTALGVASFLRMDPGNGVAEVGYISMSPALQKTVRATEAMYLMMRRVLGEMGYRRYEWKCDALNAPSRAAAERLGFRYEGTFRQAVVYKGRNRDTAWFSILDREWDALDQAFQSWLSPSNFDAGGQQIKDLKSCMPNVSDA